MESQRQTQLKDFHLRFLGIFSVETNKIKTMCLLRVCMLSCSVVSDSLRPHELQPARFLCPWDFSRQEYWGRLPFPSPFVDIVERN